MASFKLGKEIEKDVLRLQLSRVWEKGKILGPQEIRFLVGTQNFSLSQARDETKNAYSMQPTVIKNYEVTLKHAN